MNNSVLQDYEIIKPSIIEFVKNLMALPNIKTDAYAIVILENGEKIEETIISDLAIKDWSAPFNELAFAKARLSNRTSLPSREIIQNRQDLLQNGDTSWFGSVIDKNRNIVVASSGGPEEADELISSTILSLLTLQKKLRIINQLNDRGPNNKFIV